MAIQQIRVYLQCQLHNYLCAKKTQSPKRRFYPQSLVVAFLRKYVIGVYTLSIGWGLFTLNLPHQDTSPESRF